MSVSVRGAVSADLPLMQAIEAAADRMFDEIVDTSRWGAPATGDERAAEPGFLVVVGEPVVGFAHVLDLDGRAHLEQLAVLPAQVRRGLGTALAEEVRGMVRAAPGRAARGDAASPALSDRPTWGSRRDVGRAKKWRKWHESTRLTRSRTKSWRFRLECARAA